MSRVDGAFGLRLMRRAACARITAPVLLGAAGLAAVLTTAEGLVGVLVVLAAAGTAVRSGRRAGVVLAGAAGLGFLALRIWQGRTQGSGLVLSLAGVLLWMLIAWAAARTVEEIRRLDVQVEGHVRELDHRAMHDPLTGLANRDLLLDRLTHAMARTRRCKLQVAVLFLDLDNFKLINDGLGHAAGDQLLVQIGERLSAELRGTDTAARFGGDEFVVVCEDLVDGDESVLIADRIIAALCPPFIIDGREVSITASIGIAVPPSTGQAPQQLLQDADQAMYRAKQRGGGRFDVFDAVLRGRAIHRLDTEIELRQALDRDELRLVYQPIIDLTNHRITGVEALLRWKHPSRGLLSPDQFLPIAESSSLMVDIGAWVLQEACSQASRWHTITEPRLTMAINVSLRQLNSGSFDTGLSHALDRSGVDPFAIHLEITETTLLQTTPAMKSQLVVASDRGISVGLDDFGTGYSSLSLIKAFPVRFLKIDRSFTSGLGEASDDTAITNAIIDLGRHLGLQTIAEGIETPGQLAELRGLGCKLGQGFHLGRPQSARRLEPLLNRSVSPRIR